MISSTGNLNPAAESVLISAEAAGVLGGTLEGSEKGGGMDSSILGFLFCYRCSFARFLDCLSACLLRALTNL